MSKPSLSAIANYNNQADEEELPVISAPEEELPVIQAPVDETEET